jgi:hypothetical protein
MRQAFAQFLLPAHNETRFLMLTRNCLEHYERNLQSQESRDED